MSYRWRSAPTTPPEADHGVGRMSPSRPPPDVPKQNEQQNSNRDQGKPKRLLAVRIHCHGVHSNHPLFIRGSSITGRVLNYDRQLNSWLAC